MLDLGLLVTVNSDDPPYFGGYLNDNFIAVASALSLTKGEIAQLAVNSFQASFLPDSIRQKNISLLDGYFVFEKN
jgi:adenosine deaminase